MTDKPDQETIDRWHRRMAAELFNVAWQYLDNEARTAGDEAEMLGAALGSWYHWRRIGDPRNFAISDWQVSRVLAVLGDAEGALRYGRQSLDWCASHTLDPFVTAYAHEALARAAALAGEDEQRDGHLTEARRLAGQVDNTEDRAVLLEDLATIR